MTFDGIVRNGAIELERGATLPEGTRVKAVAEPAEVEPKPTLLSLLKLAGIASPFDPESSSGSTYLAGQGAGMPCSADAAAWLS
jgi:hypothetical protein